MFTRVGFAMMLLLWPLSAWAQVDTVDDVVVEGVRRTEDMAFDYVRSVSALPMGARTMAVWDRAICVSVENLNDDLAVAIRDRILGRAQALGLVEGEHGCLPNIMVIFTADAHATAKDLVERNPVAFRPTTGATQLDRDRLRRFVDVDRPVRWWSVSMPVDVQSGRRTLSIAGEHASIVHHQNSGAVSGMPPSGPPPGQTVGPPWRRTRGIQPPGNDVRDILQISFVIIDARRVGDVPISALADYIAMGILSQADVEADTSDQPTILNLFRLGSNLTEMSRWDLDYLRALHLTSVRWTHVQFQQRAIARVMAGSVHSDRD